jgi:predicted MFS family arabinose efflux permease
VILSLVQMAGVALLLAAGDSFWYLAIPVIVMSVAGPMIDVTGRMTCLAGDPAIRTRLLSLFIILMFLGGGVGSWAGTIAYDLGGWSLNVAIAMGTSVLIVLLSVLGVRLGR